MTNIDKNFAATTPAPGGELLERVVAILEEAHSAVVRSVNSQMVLAYWHIGREIVIAVQSGDDRADYGGKVLEQLSRQLGERYGRGFSVTNLRYFRLFYQAYAGRKPEIRHKPCDELATQAAPARRHKPCDVLADLAASVEQADVVRGFSAQLSWSHYRTLTKVPTPSGNFCGTVKAPDAVWRIDLPDIPDAVWTIRGQVGAIETLKRTAGRSGTPAGGPT